jgi:hypothetical protein
MMSSLVKFSDLLFRLRSKGFTESMDLNHINYNILLNLFYI